MGVSGGIGLIVVGLVFLLHVVEVDIPYINEYGLGVLLTFGGIAAVLLNLTLWRDSRPWGGRGRIVERRIERDLDDPHYL